MNGAHRAVVFDLDGTLIDSAPDLHAAVNVALETLGRPHISLKQVIGFIGNGVSKLVERALMATGGASPEMHTEALALFMESYSANMTRLTVPYPGVVACLSGLRDRDIPMGLCTNKPQEPAQLICDALGLSSFFGVVLGAGRDMAHKPDPAPLLTCIEALGAAPDTTVYVGDGAVDHETARRASVPFRFFTGGYLNSPLPPIAEDHRFDDWSDHGLWQ
ncbi:phosphoglycolate phosphatase [uncultured Roseobacter sp.]|uniref:phosphoglycolate phosphatase n=1 Tax=uncultured Roseobacter sp. TaxID=114847 RepID=UPI0026351EE2|nr:phosphoglycolate phosphatase [uncultured Roseobacter sp.]